MNIPNLITDAYIIGVIYVIAIYIIFKYVIFNYQNDRVINILLTQLGFYHTPNSSDVASIQTNLKKAEAEITKTQSSIDSDNSLYETLTIVFMFIYTAIPFIVLCILGFMGIVNFRKYQWINILISVLLNVCLIIGFQIVFLYFIFNIYTPIELYNFSGVV